MAAVLQDRRSLTWGQAQSLEVHMGSLGTGSGVQCSQGNDKWVCMLNVCYVCVHLPSCIRYFATPWTIWTLAHQAPLSMEFSRQKYWSRLPFPTPGNLPDSGIKALSLASPALAAGFFTTVPPGKLNMWLLTPQCFLFLFFFFCFPFFPPPIPLFELPSAKPHLPYWILECSLENPNGCRDSLLYVAIWSSKSKSLVYQLITPPQSLLIYKNKSRKAYGKKSPTQKWNL